MSNIEHIIDSINEKLVVIDKLNNLLFVDYDKLLANEFDEKHISEFTDMKNKYDDFLDFYNHNSIIFTSNYYFLKRETNVLNSFSNNLEKINYLTSILNNLSIEHTYSSNDFIVNGEINIDKLYLFMYTKFNEFLTIEDVFNTLNNYILEFENYINIYIIVETDLIKFKKLFSKYRKINPIIVTASIDYDICSCGQIMIINTVTSELMCASCGSIKELIGTIFEDSQFYNQEGTRYKHGSYIPSHHCKYWLDRIIAKENNEVTQASIEEIKKCIKRDNIQNLKNLSVEQFRIYLKKTKLSKLNDHIPLIKKYITGFSPPQLTHDEINIIYNYFDKAVKLYSRIKSDSSTNFIYYPYLLYKILELIITDESRRNKILSGIHLQGYTTLVNNDKKWKKICEFYPEFTYKPTDRNDFH
jgi:hypothetical protein